MATLCLTFNGYIDWQSESSQSLQLMLPLVVLILLAMGFLLTRSSDVVRQVRHKNRHLVKMIEQSAELILVADVKGHIVYVNQAFEKASGYFKHELIGRPTSVLKSGSHEDEFYTELWETVSAGKTFEGIFINRCKDGSLFYEDKVIMPLFRRGEICQYVSSGRDISDRSALKKRSQQLDSLAHYDLLTGLYNQSAIVQHIDEAIGRAKQNDTLLVVAYIDLDGFVPINDAYGHKIGDKYLQHVACCIQGALRKTDHAARMAGDEFILVLEGFEDESQISANLQKIQQQSCLPVDLDNIDMEVRMSIGAAVFQGEAVDAQKLIVEAEHGMHLAKQQGATGLS